MSGVPPDEYVPEDELEEPTPIPVAPGQSPMFEATLEAQPIIDEEAIGVLISTLISIDGKLERIATAVETSRPASSITPQPWELNKGPDQTPQAQPQPFQPGQPIQGNVAQPAQGEPSPGWVCPVHGQRKVVPGGFSQRTQKPYSAFAACPVQGCSQKPPRGA